MRLKWCVIVGALLLLSVPSEAFAWGPATHIAMGQSVLDQLGLLPAGVAAILARYSGAYLYGCVAADVVFAKRLSRVKQFCHHWSTAFGMFEAGETDSAKAFSYGYLSHLAADTVAHGKFVPRQVAVSSFSVNFGHLYWELRADAASNDPTRKLLGEVLEQDHAEHHYALKHHLKGTFLPYKLNRVLFDRMNSLALNENFGQTMNLYGRLSRWPLSPELLAGYHGESVDRILAVLSDGAKSVLLREDPNGSSALLQARIHRRETRRMRGRGLSVDRRVKEAAESLLPMASDRRSCAAAVASSAELEPEALATTGV